QGHPTQYGWMWSTGDINRFLERHYYNGEYSKAKAYWLIGKGVLSLFLPGLKKFKDSIFDWEPMKIFYDGVSIQRASVSAITACANEFDMMGFKPWKDTPKGKLNFIIACLGPRRYPKALLQCRLGWPIEGPGIINAVDEDLALVNEVDSTHAFDSELFRWEKGKVLYLRSGGMIEVIKPKVYASRTRSGRYELIRTT
ncbi:hypothetical protein ACFLZN_02735, partial [Nanoarchaeota archaeon]